MLDVCHLHERGLLWSGDPDRVAVERALDPPRHDRVLLAIALVAHQLLAQMGIDSGIGTAAGRAGERNRAHALALSAHEQLRAGRDQRGVATTDAKDKTGGKRVAQDSEHRRGVIRARRVYLNLAREHDLLKLASADRLSRASDGGLEMLGRHAARDLEAARGSRIEQRQWRARKLAEPAIQLAKQILCRVIRLSERGERETHMPLAFVLLAHERDLRDDERRGLKAPPRGG